MNFSNAIKLIEAYANEADQDLQMLQAALSISPLPSQLAEFAPFLAEAQAAVGFLLRVDALIAKAKTALGL